MKKITKIALSVLLLCAPLMACGKARAEPCGIRCLGIEITHPEAGSPR